MVRFTFARVRLHLRPWPPSRQAMSAFTSGHVRLHVRPWLPSRQAISAFTSGRVLRYVGPWCLTTQGASKETSGSFGRYILIFCLTTQGASKGRPWLLFCHKGSHYFLNGQIFQPFLAAWLPASASVLSSPRFLSASRPESPSNFLQISFESPIYLLISFASPSPSPSLYSLFFQAFILVLKEMRRF